MSSVFRGESSKTPHRNLGGEIFRPRGAGEGKLPEGDMIQPESRGFEGTMDAAVSKCLGRLFATDALSNKKILDKIENDLKLELSAKGVNFGQEDIKDALKRIAAKKPQLRLGPN